MNIVKNGVLCVLFLGTFACASRNADGDYFTGKIQHFNPDTVTTYSTIGIEVPAENYGYGMFAVYDSLAVFWNPMLPEHFFKISNIDTGNDLGCFCTKGRGPEDFYTVGPVSQFFKKQDDILTLLYAFNEGKLFSWNINRSIEQGVSVYDTIISYKDQNVGAGTSYHSTLYQGSNLLLTRMSSNVLDETERSQSDYEQRTIGSNELLKGYSIYRRDAAKGQQSASALDDFLYSTDVLKPDGTKIAQAMRCLAQINILDLRTSDVIGYRMKNSPDFSLFEKEQNEKIVYYNSIQADDKYIYAVYWGEKQWDASVGNPIPFLNTIHVFDWNGNMIKQFKTDRNFFRIVLDQMRNRLYAADLETDEIYYLDLNEL